MNENDSPTTSNLTRQEQEWFEAGKKAYFAGTARNDYPFKRALRRANLDICWQIGWDTGHLLSAIDAGKKAHPDDACPYSDPELAAHWVTGWRATHGLQAVRKDPTPRLARAASDVST